MYSCLQWLLKWAYLVNNRWPHHLVNCSPHPTTWEIFCYFVMSVRSWKRILLIFANKWQLQVGRAEVYTVIYRCKLEQYVNFILTPTWNPLLTTLSSPQHWMYCITSTWGESTLIASSRECSLVTRPNGRLWGESTLIASSRECSLVPRPNGRLQGVLPQQQWVWPQHSLHATHILIPVMNCL